MPPKLLQAAALGGLFTGVLSALPFVNVANCCCLWVLGGGFLAAYLLQQDQPFRISVLDGLLVGLGAGLVGAVVATVLGIPIRAMMAPFQQQIMRMVIERGDLPPEARSMLESMTDTPGALVLGTALQFAFSLVVNAIFAPVGGMLFALFSSRPPAPPATPAAPPMPPGPPAPPPGPPPPPATPSSDRS